MFPGAADKGFIQATACFGAELNAPNASAKHSVSVPRLGYILLLQNTNFGQLSFNLLKESGVTNSHRHLIGQGAEQVGVAFVKTGYFIFLHVQHANYLAVYMDGDSHFSVSIGQKGVGQPIWGLAHVVNRDDPVAAGSASYQAGGRVQGNCVPLLFHLASRLAGAGDHYQTLTPFFPFRGGEGVNDVNVGVIIAKVVFDLIHHLQQQLVKVQNGRQALAEGSRNFHTLGAGNHSLFQISDQMTQLRSHTVERLRQIAYLVLTFYVNFQIQVAGCNLFGCLG